MASLAVCPKYKCPLRPSMAQSLIPCSICVSKVMSENDGLRTSYAFAAFILLSFVAFRRDGQRTNSPAHDLYSSDLLEVVKHFARIIY